MKLLNYLLTACICMMYASCKNNRQPATIYRSTETETTRDLRDYRASATIRHNLINTFLDIRFDWAKRYLLGKAVITLKPHFHATDSIILDARGMVINRVSLLSGTDTVNLSYNYSGDSLHIRTPLAYQSTDTFRIYIDYVARPDELKDSEGSAAISSDKGLYFINPDGKEKGKPRQIWTQGETQSNSVWFPTIDVPNQKMTQEFRITVDTTFKTLSNGLLTDSRINGDGTRTDTWKQSLPHAPYLAMMAIGPFAVVSDRWKGLEVSYYLEPEYEKVARKIFGNTPEMLDYYSKSTGVPYPWEKYSQVVVRDFVSGAMENTTATLHGEFLHRDERELLDGTNEDVIAHELFHHWFGDYVTCESWSNLPLNESFATYGEYLWNEYKYGRDEADIGLQDDRNAYLRESKNEKKDLIRFYYEDREDMFDRHSYQKGGCILHMLRKYTGDVAFFKGLQVFLQSNRFRPVEVHQLRLAFEEVTGEDLNWFFNQWFLDSGHPELDISYGWDEATKTCRVAIRQEQQEKDRQIFRIPIDIDVYETTGIRRIKVVLDQREQTFDLNCNSRPELVNVDAERMIVGVRNDNHSEAEWAVMYRRAPLFQDRYDAVTALLKDYQTPGTGASIALEALGDKNWKIREYALTRIEPLAKSDDKEKVMNLLMDIGRNDRKARVRAAAIKALDRNFKEEDFTIYLKNAVLDSSFNVMEEALLALAERNLTEAMKMAAGLEKISHKRVFSTLCNLYSRHGGDEQFSYMMKAIDNAQGNSLYGILQSTGRYLKRCEADGNINGVLSRIYQEGKNSSSWMARLGAVQSLSEYGKYCGEQQTVSAKAGDTKGGQDWTKRKEAAEKYAGDLKKNETNSMLLKIYGSQQ